MNDETQRGQPADEPREPEASPPENRADAVDQSFGEESPSEVVSSEQQVAALEAELKEADRQVRLAQADLENFRKRVRRDYEEQIRYAAVPLIRDILDVRDNLHRALEAAQSNDQAAGLREGVAIVAKQLDDVLHKHHCRAIPAEGELFDPNYHEAISQMPSPNQAAGTVVHEATRGYQMHDRVVRPSQVVVSAGPAEAGPGE